MSQKFVDRFDTAVNPQVMDTLDGFEKLLVSSALQRYSYGKIQHGMREFKYVVDDEITKGLDLLENYLNSKHVFHGSRGDKDMVSDRLDGLVEEMKSPDYLSKHTQILDLFTKLQDEKRRGRKMKQDLNFLQENKGLLLNVDQICRSNSNQKENLGYMLKVLNEKRQKIERLTAMLNENDQFDESTTKNEMTMLNDVIQKNSLI